MMIALLMVFDLTDSPVSLGELRSTLQESKDRYRQMDGLRQKVYLSDESGKFGGFYLFETQDALDAALPRLRASATQRRTGVTPRLVQFNVEAIVEGHHSTPDLSQVSHTIA